MSTWAALVKGWVGYTESNPPIGTSTNETTESDREEIVDQWLMVDDLNAPATLIDVTNEEPPSPEMLRRRKVWQRRMEKAKIQSPSPTLPPRAKVLRKTGTPYTKKPAERTKTKRKAPKTSSTATGDSPVEDNNEVTSDVLPASSSPSSPGPVSKKSYVQAARPGHGYANNHCRVSNFSRSQQHNKQIQQPSKKN